MKVNKDSCRMEILRKIKRDMSKDRADPERLSKWLKLMDCKKKLFAIEDEIDHLTKELKK